MRERISATRMPCRRELTAGHLVAMQPKLATFEQGIGLAHTHFRLMLHLLLHLFGSAAFRSCCAFIFVSCTYLLCAAATVCLPCFVWPFATLSFALSASSTAH